ncbi:MAG TPA: NAD(P)-dependent alcohol dehydrogenase [Nitrospira sp.]|nr:NAD(P)-dependent alcohol dehydrogenase [Nitrospira sp.]HRI83400.1 NAD(P)-dependent alcohol dehydrogenase [Opitutaceae bacterium]HRJ48569.1 NAD(P)-dependent alcohol dehydrogenase [Opitutaceae bacterium]
MLAVVLEQKHVLRLREIALAEEPGPHDVRIRIHTVGVCGSDVHYYRHGAIGPFVVREPLVLGHEAAGTVVEVGRAVPHLRVGDRVCMEPGIPDAGSRAARLGRYNLDPAVRFWATPPVHGCLRPTVVHPAAFTFRLPDNVSFAEGAMVEPLAVGMHAVNKARVRPGDVAVVIGAGPIGLLTALAALAGGCSRIFVSDVVPERLSLAAGLGPVTPVDVRHENLAGVVRQATDGWGADHVFEASGHGAALSDALAALAPGGAVTLIGMPGAPVPIDVVAAQVKEARIETVFRYAHMFPRALALMEIGALNVRSLITDRFPFGDSSAAFDYAASPKPATVKIQIELP